MVRNTMKNARWKMIILDDTDLELGLGLVLSYYHEAENSSVYCTVGLIHNAMKMDWRQCR